MIRTAFLTLSLFALVPSATFAQVQAEGKTSPTVPFRGIARHETIKRNGKHYKASSTFPRFTTHTSLTRYTNATLRSEATSNLTKFVKDAITNTDANSPPTAGLDWEAENKVELYFYAPTHLISLAQESYAFTGGAHGNYGTSGRNFGLLPGTTRPRELKLADFFRAGSPYRSRVEKQLLAKLRANKDQEATWIIEGSVKNFDANQLNNFVAERGGLHWFFAPYAVGPFANGEYEVKLSSAELGPDFKRALVAH